MPTKTLADLPESPEAKILRSVLGTLRGDSQLTDVFSPIRKLENPTREAFLTFADFSMSVQPYQVKPDDHPSKRSTVHFGVLISAYLPREQGEEESDLVWLNLGSYLRSVLWGLAVEDPDFPSPITFATSEFRYLTPLIVQDRGTRILSYQAIFETDLDPLEGTFSA